MLIKHSSGYEVDSPDKIAKKLIAGGHFTAVKKEAEKKAEPKKESPKKAEKK